MSVWADLHFKLSTGPHVCSGPIEVAPGSSPPTLQEAAALFRAQHQRLGQPHLHLVVGDASLIIAALDSRVDEETASTATHVYLVHLFDNPSNRVEPCWFDPPTAWPRVSAVYVQGAWALPGSDVLGARIAALPSVHSVVFKHSRSGGDGAESETRLRGAVEGMRACPTLRSFTLDARAIGNMPNAADMATALCDMVTAVPSLQELHLNGVGAMGDTDAVERLVRCCVARPTGVLDHLSASATGFGLPAYALPLFACATAALRVELMSTRTVICIAAQLHAGVSRCPLEDLEFAASIAHATTEDDALDEATERLVHAFPSLRRLRVTVHGIELEPGLRTDRALRCREMRQRAAVLAAAGLRHTPRLHLPPELWDQVILQDFLSE